MVEKNIKSLVCEDCENEVDFQDIRRWKYEKSIQVCEDCYGERLIEGEE